MNLAKAFPSLFLIWTSFTVELNQDEFFKEEESKEKILMQCMLKRVKVIQSKIFLLKKHIKMRIKFCWCKITKYNSGCH